MSTNNLEPRAKIGDVVLLQFIASPPEEVKITEAFESGIYHCLLDGYDCVFQDKDILKNLTTNISYEAND